VFGSLPDALAAYADRETVFIGGGASVYGQVLSGDPLADRLELTLVEADPDGDAFFPPWEHFVGDVYEMSEAERHVPAAGRPGFRFETYVRRPKP
jgi:dihydrofolate reductase